MPYNEALVARLRDRFSKQPGAMEKKMFGGITYMVNGNMCCGVVNDDLMVRVGPDGHEDALAQPYARPMDFTKRPMKGMVFVAKDGYATEADLDAWIQRGLKFVQSLPAK